MSLSEFVIDVDDPAATRTRECGCPPQVVRCVHFDGQMLLLTRPGILPPHQDAHHGVRYIAVGIAPDGPTVTCPGCGARGWRRDPHGRPLYAGTDLAEAEAVLRAVELELLGRAG